MALQLPLVVAPISNTDRYTAKRPFLHTPSRLWDGGTSLAAQQWQPTWGGVGQVSGARLAPSVVFALLLLLLLLLLVADLILGGGWSLCLL